MTLPRPAKRRPRASKKRPRGAPEAPRDAQERPKAGQVTFKRYPREPHTLPKWSLASPKMNFQHDLCGQLCSKGFWSDLVSFFGLRTKLAICKKPTKPKKNYGFYTYGAFAHGKRARKEKPRKIRPGGLRNPPRSVPEPSKLAQVGSSSPQDGPRLLQDVPRRP